MIFDWKDYGTDIIVGSSTDPTEQLKKLTPEQKKELKMEHDRVRKRHNNVKPSQNEKAKARVRAHYQKTAKQ